MTHEPSNILFQRVINSWPRNRLPGLFLAEIQYRQLVPSTVSLARARQRHTIQPGSLKFSRAQTLDWWGAFRRSQGLRCWL